MGKIKKFPRKILWRYPLRTVVVALLCGYILFFAVGQQFQLRQFHQVVAQLEVKKNVLLDEQSRLQQQIEQLRQEEMVEKIAREQLGLIKPGEKLLILRE